MTDVDKRKLVLFVDSLNCTDSVSTAKFTSAETDSDFVSFTQAAAGGARDYFLALTLKQNTASGTIWNIMWTQGGSDLPVDLWPNGMPVGGVPTASQPKFTATVTVKDPDGDVLGGEANASPSARQVTEVEWQCLAKPVRTVA